MTPFATTMKLLLLCLVAIAAVSRDASAQSLDDLTAGVRVRVRQFDETHGRDRGYEGDVVTHDSTRLVIRRGVDGTDTLPFFAMKSLQMQRGHTTRAKLVTVGAVTGALAGGVVVWATHLAPITGDDANGSSDNRKLRSLAVASIPALAAVGITIGMLADTKLWVSVRFLNPVGAGSDR
jgi:hypothetical protein